MNLFQLHCFEFFVEHPTFCALGASACIPTFLESRLFVPRHFPKRSEQITQDQFASEVHWKMTPRFEENC